MWLVVIFIVVLIFIVYMAVSNSRLEEANTKRTASLAELRKQYADFHEDIKFIGRDSSFRLGIDKENRQILCLKPFSKTGRFVPFDSIMRVELVEGNTVRQSKSMMRTIGGTLVGGALAGGAGAVVGGLSGDTKQKKKVSRVSVKLYLRDMKQPTLMVTCFDSVKEYDLPDGVSDSDRAYKFGLIQAQDICNVIGVIIDEEDRRALQPTPATTPTAPALEATPATTPTTPTSIVDQLEKLSALREKGVLTDEEFTRLKTSLLHPETSSDHPSTV